MDLKSSNIRNVAILGHQGSGKTSLVESIYSIANGTEKGSIEKKNTISDYLKEEKNRLSSVSTSIVPVIYENHKINLLDIPGNDDFIWEVLSVTRSVKGAVLVIDASSKVQVGTIKHFKMLRKRGIPTLIFVNKMDKGNPNFEDIMNDITTKLGKICVPFSYPLGHNDNFDGFVNVVTLKARKYNGKECVDDVIHEDKKMKVFELHNTICEAVALTDDSLLEKFFSGEPLTNEEIRIGLRSGVLKGELVPVIFGSALNNIGIHTILSMFIDYMPSPVDLKPYVGVNEKGEEIERKTDVTEPFSAYVIKTMVDPYLGTINILKIDSGVLHLGDEVYCPELSKSIKISSLFTLKGKEQTNITEAIAGDIVATSKQDEINTAFTLCDKNNYICYKEIKFPTAVCFKAISLKDKKDEEKLNPVLAKLKKEDPTLEIKRNVETKQLLLGGLSESHLQYVIDKVKNTYILNLLTEDPKICYRETIKGTAKATGKYIKQSGGSGFYGVVEMEFSPAKESIFTEEIFGGSVPKNYFPAVEKGFYEALQSGLLAGFPVIGVKATLLDGKYHPVDSNELAFKMASILAFKEAYMHCIPTILEPILKISINISNQYLGDVLSDLNSRRAKVQEVNDKEDDTSVIIATIPESETMDYVTKLKALTQGSGFFNREFYEYEEVPESLKAKVIENCSLLKK
ncbi:MAG: elongation factor G [Firmicutes bacterium]|uniref:Elongation factor G n=1 Tax=Candidatus Onthovivens merdipullorum TaxID=2840889 RepID=A0A9D9DIB3_9BACL|nr:elongation factor G [Candidatus Onthovivens merdipullorum]